MFIQTPIEYKRLGFMPWNFNHILSVIGVEDSMPFGVTELLVITLNYTVITGYFLNQEILQLKKYPVVKVYLTEIKRNWVMPKCIKSFESMTEMLGFQF